MLSSSWLSVIEAFESEGFEVYKGVINSDEIDKLRVISDVLAAEEKKACVRGVAAKSLEILGLAESNALRQFLPADYLLVRSILFDKTPEENWPVLWHQDLSIAVKGKKELRGYGPWSVKDGVAHVQPPSEVLQQMVTLRVHLDPSAESNGALRVIRSSNKSGKMKPSSVPAAVERGEEVVCACVPGDVLKMSPLILHASRRSEQPSRRRVLHFEYAHKDSLHPELRWCK